MQECKDFKKYDFLRDPVSDLKKVYIKYIRSLCEQSSVVLDSSIALQNQEDLENVQKVALMIILKCGYQNYKTSLNMIDLQSLREKIKDLCLTFDKIVKETKKLSTYPLPPNNRFHNIIP